MNVDPWPKAAIAAVTNYVWATLLSTWGTGAVGTEVAAATWDDGDD